ncbi:MAG TPA: hypothetical protein VF894_13770 [Anaeromyxobacter sp.]
MNGAIACPACKDRVLAARDGGSRVGRLLAAGGLGLLAAIAGATVWIVIVRVTHYEIGLVAIGVGLLVGAAVRRGSGGRGGWGYQTLAVVLTYSAMVAYYVPYVLEGLRKGASEAHATSEPGGATAPAHAMLEPGGATAPAHAAPPEAGAGAAGTGGSATAEESSPKVSFLGIVIALAFVVGIAFAAPFLAGAENIIGILILLFALYEAWKLNKRQVFAVTGPFQVAPASRPAASA